LDLDASHAGALGAGGDGQGAGCLAKLLPPLPPEERGEIKSAPRNSVSPAHGSSGS
jgi:hypothetical protein